MQIPNNYQLLYTTGQIQNEVKRTGLEVTEWARTAEKKTGMDIIGVPVLRGGIFYFADLVRSINASVEIGPVRSWGYVKGENQNLIDKIKVNLFDLNVEGRAVLLIDDICDTGRTLKTLKEALLEKGAAEVHAAVLIWRSGFEDSLIPDYHGFKYSGPEWFVGYGMEDGDRYSNLADIYVIKNK
jgi:hypoxanthine phosphoribosyltransferase